MSGEEQKKVSSVEEYRRLRGKTHKVTLPTSGAIFEIKVLTIKDYIEGGLTDIPNEFFKFIQEIQQGVQSDNQEELKKALEMFEKFLSISIDKGIISPPVILKYDEEKAKTHIVYGELSQEEQALLIDMITGRLPV